MPIYLHLFQRQETRRLSFPALRYLERTERETVRVADHFGLLRADGAADGADGESVCQPVTEPVDVPSEHESEHLCPVRVANACADGAAGLRVRLGVLRA